MGSRILSIDAGFLVFIAMLILLLPIRLIVAWLIAIIIHELGHYTALRLFRIRVYSVRLRVFGAVMITEPISGWREAFCAAAGPIAGFCVLLVARWMPCTAVFAFVTMLPVLKTLKERHTGTDDENFTIGKMFRYLFKNKYLLHLILFYNA